MKTRAENLIDNRLSYIEKTINESLQTEHQLSLDNTDISGLRQTNLKPDDGINQLGEEIELSDNHITTLKEGIGDRLLNDRLGL